ncbi:hypothetical protein GIB67_007954 [Kingdonia uniflora]|uniref:Vacuolar protein sorting-associated protein 13 VPS13 adaptor binding domain-containing protein n=1 Tax=Kingdonia uniflora TaxID=39325 RepID=A0A7J7LTF6_9MAGN|nr:hypothetical protein GIB67_007954 [Kingdonia uniflora]
MIRKSKFSAPLNSYVLTDVSLKSTAQLNLNVTEPLIEIMFRANELIKDMWGQAAADDLPASWRFLGPVDNVYSRRYAPYTLLNETSLPLLFQVYRGFVNVDDYDIPVLEEGNIVQPGSSVPIYVYETPEEEVFRFRPPQSSDNLNEKKSNGVAHYMISIELDGTSGPSIPISMDIVGLSYFEVNFSKASEKLEVNKDEDASKYSRKFQEKSIDDSKRGYVVPVVFDVSIQRYTKLIRLYSTVILLNATSVPLELRFDIPFGVSPKVLGPIHPGQEFALPVHLAEAGRMRWRPLGDSFLWSEAHMLSNLLSQENRIGFLRSFVCYPSHPSSDPFRCCISVQHIHFPSSSLINLERSEKCLIHYVTLTTPLMVRNYLPSKESFVTVESGGVSRSIILPEVERVSVFHIDSTHDLGITFNINGFKPSSSKFSRVETFTTTARFNDGKFFSSETLALYPDSSKGPIYVTLEKVMDASCGAREISISVPFLLYNCTGLPLTVVDSGNEVDGKKFCTVVSCYSLFGSEQLLARKHGLGLVSAEQKLSASPFGIHNLSNSFANHNPISVQDSFNLYSSRSLSNLNRVCTSNQLCFSDKGVKDSKILENDNRKAIACMYSPHPSSSSSELMVRLNMCLPEHISDNFTSSSWSRPFFLVPASGSASVVVPKAHTSGAFILSVTSSPIIGPFSGTTRAVSFQPRYVISNACSKDLCYKQKGTDSVLLLGTGQHSHLHWDDTTRELLVSLRFNEPGWLWSGSFFPDHLGDTQVKMRNYVCDSLNMIRVEVQNADVSIRGEKVVGSAHGNSGTNLILLSDDTSGFMPYRIDNFSKERLRIYQKSCETCETIVHSYTSCPYAWDEPCYPHRLVIELLLTSLKSKAPDFRVLNSGEK